MVLGPAVDPASGPNAAMSPGPGPSPCTVMVRGTPPSPDMKCQGTVTAPALLPGPDMPGPDMAGHAIVIPPGPLPGPDIM